MERASLADLRTAERELLDILVRKRIAEARLADLEAQVYVAVRYFVYLYIDRVRKLELTPSRHL